MEFIDKIQQSVFLVAMTMLRMAPIFIGGSLTPMARMPKLTKLVLLTVISIFLVLQSNSTLIVKHLSLVYFAKLILQELFLGLVIAFGIQAAIAAIQTMGRVIDMQIGLSATGIFDPSNHQSEAVIGSLLTMIFSLLIFEFNIHIDLINILAISYKVIPIGVGIDTFDVFHLTAYLGTQFVFALIMAFPIVIALFVIDMLVGFASKTMPQANIYFVGLPLKIGVGLAVLSIASKQFLPAITKIFSEVNQYWLVVVSN